MALIKIKQLEERIATSGLFMGTPEPEVPGEKPIKFRRKLEPGEIVDVPDDLTFDDGENLVQALFETGKIDMLPPHFTPTRPFEYENVREGKFCSPSFKPLDPDEEAAMEKARAKVQARLDEELSKSQPKADSPDSDKPAKKSRKKTSSRRSSLRRQALGVDQSGEASIPG